MYYRNREYASKTSCARQPLRLVVLSLRANSAHVVFPYIISFSPTATVLSVSMYLILNLCSLLRKSVAKKDPKDYAVWEQALMAAGDDKCDWTDKRYLEPILRAVKE